jgi:membrane-bound serine protease (ClpP class)
MLAGIVMAGQTHLVPRTERELQSLATSLLVIACSGAAFFMASLMLSRHFGSLPVLNRLMLRPASPGAGGGAKQAGNKPASTEAQREGGTAAAASSQTAEQTLGVGDWGFAVSALRPAGRAKFGRRIVDVLTDGSFVDRGRQVRIVEIEGSRVVVRDVEDV